MMAIDFSMPASVAIPIANVVFFPLWLLASARIKPLAERHASRFLVSSVVTLFTWAASMLVSGRPFDAWDWLVGACLVAGMLMFYLEIWGLMTRGYSLGILLTLLKAGRPMTSQEIFDGYRDGEGLSWIMRHRLGGLSSTGFVSRCGDELTLTPGRGAFIARLYRLCIVVLGLRRTG